MCIRDSLLSGLITFHVIVALLIICNVILCYHLSSKNDNNYSRSKPLNFFIVISLTLFIIQMVLGTEVRESVDELLKLYGFNFRENIIESIFGSMVLKILNIKKRIIMITQQELQLIYLYILSMF